MSIEKIKIGDFMKKENIKCLTAICVNYKCKKMVGYSDLRKWENMKIPNNELPMKDLTENCKDIILRYN